MENRLVFYIDNRAYSIPTDDKVLEKELRKYLDVNKNNSIKELFAAYANMTQEHIILKKELEKLSNKIPNL